MPRTLRRRRRMLETMLLAAVGVVGVVSFPAGTATADSTGAYAINHRTLTWSCAPHPVFLGPARPAALAAARSAIAELEVATGRSWPIVADAAAADVTIDWDLTVRVGATGEIWLQQDGDRLITADIVLDPKTADVDLPGVLRHHLGHLVGLGHVADPSQVMSADVPTFDHFQPGDLAGLEGLGASCA